MAKECGADRLIVAVVVVPASPSMAAAALLPLAGLALFSGFSCVAALLWKNVGGPLI